MEGTTTDQLPGLETPMGTCSVPNCSTKATTTLRAQPSGHVKNERLEFGFCADHATEYEAMGYERA